VREGMKEKYILGVNGWNSRSHDASAALLRCAHGKIEIIAAAEEERFIRRKHAYDTLPLEATKFCLAEGKISPKDIDSIAFGWDMPLLYSERGLKKSFNKKELIELLLGINPKKDINLEFVNHHYSHALSAFSPSGFKSAAVLVVDGQGETESVSAWKADDSGLERLAVSDISSSPGYFYQALTRFVGFKINQPGKTMGLAPYGNKERHLKRLRELFLFDKTSIQVPSFNNLVLGKKIGDYLPLDEQDQVKRFWFEQFSRITGLNPNDSSRRYSFRSFPKDYMDLASAGQEVLEQIILHLAKNLTSVANENNICLSGGVALNSVANGKIIEENSGLNIYVQPGANDAGVSVGAALEIARREGYSINNVKMSVYLGKAYTNHEILEILKESGVSFKEDSDMPSRMAKMIGQGKVLGLFQGRFEFGPRALGNRSFIADPQKKEILDYVNKEIKGREEGRPLAPTILECSAPEFFSKKVCGPHMTLNYQLTKSKLEAVRHVDGSTRPQILKYKDNPLYYEQIKAIEKETGVNAVLNTSLNLHEPIINTPQEALNLLERTKVDAIIFNNTFIAYRK